MLLAWWVVSRVMREKATERLLLVSTRKYARKEAGIKTGWRSLQQLKKTKILSRQLRLLYLVGASSSCSGGSTCTWCGVVRQLPSSIGISRNQSKKRRRRRGGGRSRRVRLNHTIWTSVFISNTGTMRVQCKHTLGAEKIKITRAEAEADA